MTMDADATFEDDKVEASFNGAEEDQVALAELTGWVD